MNSKGNAKWRADRPARTNTGGSIRGKTISHPIPFPDDDEFPIRTPGSGIALPMGPEALEREIRLRTSMATEELHPSQPPPGDEQPMSQSTTFSTGRSIQPDSRRTQVPTAMRNSVAGSVPSGSSVGRPERKKSSLKTVLGRLFGRKRKPSPAPASNPNTETLRAEQHRSDPTALGRRQPEQGSASKRSASLPINEFNRALRSHSITADDIPQSVRNSLVNRESLQSNVQRRSRRATTPSRLWTPNKTPGYLDWTGLSPRPASTHPRGSTIISDADACLIGTAVTSSGHPNRRSRSLGEIRNTAIIVTRRRSDEIKYWRESYDPTILSPMSSTKADAEEPVMMDEDGARDMPPHEPPQPFNFGPLGALAGMKITEVASLETRVNRLEDRMLNIERMVSRSLENMHSVPPPLHDPVVRRSPGRGSSIPRPKTRDSETSIPRSSRFKEQQERQYLHEPVPEMRSSSYGSNRRPSTTNSQTNLYHSFDSENVPQIPSDITQNSSQTPGRPLSTSTTIRGLPSSPSTSRDGLTGEHYTTLTNMILSEQSARQNLELLVLSLQEQIRILSSRSLSPRISALNEKLDPNTAFSTFEQDDSSDDGRDGRYMDDNETNEVYRTPMEEAGSIFGDVLRNSATEELKGGTRTLSLSQITLGRGQQQRVGVKF